jgi:hypothetical protein
MLFGPSPKNLPKFNFANDKVDVVQEHIYVGVSFNFRARNIFKSHYEKKVSTA